MNIQNIDKQLAYIGQAMDWTKNVPVSEQLEYRKKLINIRRELKKIRYAVSEPCSTAAFGESQMGKSYLVSAMLSTPSHPFSVTDGKEQYDFISEINPSRPNSTIEATGVITRFTTHSENNIPSGYLKVQLLSVPDIIIILCEAYYNQVDYARESILPKDVINEYLNNIVPAKPSIPVTYLTDDDILDLRDYINNSSILQKKCNHILESEFFNFFVLNIAYLSDDQVSQLIQLLWNKNEFICKLWQDMQATFRTLNYEQRIYARFDSVLKRKGTLLDVARLDEMYGSPEDIGSDYEPFAEIKLASDGTTIKIEKSFLSSLIAELSFVLQDELTVSRPFLKDLDILDFPGARRPEQIKQSKLGEGKNLSTVLRRGKVSYLFNKYSAAKRINTLLFCHNNSMSGESSMGGLLDKWVKGNIGIDAREREEYVKISAIAPLFIIGTWFNKDLEYQDDAPNDEDNLNARWNRRFNVVLEKEVLKSLGDDFHWFNMWATSKHPFQNIYMLRDFKYSKMIYKGYDPKSGQPESGDPIAPPTYPSFFEDLKKSFIDNDFVKLHFESPLDTWNDAASCAMDGTKRIINSLNVIAPNVSQAREDKFAVDLKKVVKDFVSLLEQYYHPESSDEKLKLAKRQSGAACIHLDRMIGKDSYSFGRLMDTMMVAESEVYELVHSQLLGEERPMPMSDEESQIFMSAGLDSSLSHVENIERLCDYLGVDDEEECKQMLADSGVDLEKLLSQSQMMAGKADNLIAAVETMWHDNVLMNRTVRSFESVLPSVSTIVSSLWNLYVLLGTRRELIHKVREYINNIDKETSIGIIADYLSMQLNEFTSTFGYSFYSEEMKSKLLAKNEDLKLNLDEKMLNPHKSDVGIELLSDLYKQKEMLSGSSFVSKDREFLAKFPQFMRVWRWEQQLRLGYIYASELPDYDVKANGVLKGIIENIKS